MPTPPAPPPADPPPAPPPADPPEPRDLLKVAVREVLDEWAAERAADPQRTNPARTFFHELLGIK